MCRISEALALVDDPASPLGLVWCDLLLDKLPDPELTNRPVIGLSSSFPCHWSFDAKRGLSEEMSFDRGVAGYFVFPNASFMRQVPASGEFVQWLQRSFSDFDTIHLDRCTEIGNSTTAARHWEMRGYALFSTTCP